MRAGTALVQSRTQMAYIDNPRFEATVQGYMREQLFYTNNYCIAYVEELAAIFSLLEA